MLGAVRLIMKLTLFGKLLFGGILLFLFVQNAKLQNTDNDNLYILHTRNEDIKCNYHNSRDLNNGWLGYYDVKTKKEEWVEGWKVDSVTVLAENFWTCGPRNEKLKYIDKTVK